MDSPHREANGSFTHHMRAATFHDGGNLCGVHHNQCGFEQCDHGAGKHLRHTEVAACRFLVPDSVRQVDDYKTFGPVPPRKKPVLASWRRPVTASPSCCAPMCSKGGSPDLTFKLLRHFGKSLRRFCAVSTRFRKKQVTNHVDKKVCNREESTREISNLFAAWMKSQGPLAEGNLLWRPNDLSLLESVAQVNTGVRLFPD